jgi:hypothetical protein
MEEGNKVNTRKLKVEMTISNNLIVLEMTISNNLIVLADNKN